MAKIIAPNKKYNGETASVIFVDGVGETADTYLLSWFREHGYTVEETEPEPETETETETEPGTEAGTETEPGTETVEVKKPRSRSAKKTEGE